MGGSKYWLRYYSNDGVHSVQNDLEDLGYEESSVGSVMVFFGFQRHAGIDAYGGGAAAWPYRDNPNDDPCLLTSAAYWAMEIQDSWLELDNGNMPAGVCQHEFSHNMDHIFAASYISAVRDGADIIPHHGDNQDTMPEPYDVHAEFQQLCYQQIDEADWFTIDSYWATAYEAVDNDDDGVPDYGDFPVTEATLGTSTSSVDSDRDGLTDAEELVPGAWYYVFQSDVRLDPTNPDTDGDGVVDGADPYPLVTGDNVIINNTPTINGVIGANEYVQIASTANCPAPASRRTPHTTTTRFTSRSMSPTTCCTRRRASCIGETISSFTLTSTTTATPQANRITKSWGIRIRPRTTSSSNCIRTTAITIPQAAPFCRASN